MKKAYLQMHIAILLWGFTAILGKLIVLDEGMLVWYRMGIASISTLIFVLISRASLKLTQKEIINLVGISFLITLHWITFYGAIKASNVSIAISCFSSIALFTALLNPIINRVNINRNEIILGCGVVLGIGIIFSLQQFYWKGILLALTSAFLGALFTILNKNVSEKLDPASITFYELFFGFILLSLMLPLWFRINTSSFSIPSNLDWRYLIILAVACTTLPFTLSMHSMKKLDAFTMNLTLNLEPLYSIILAIVLFHEDKTLGFRFYLGTAIILITVLWHGYTRISNLLDKKILDEKYRYD
ncbi:MAG: DMT family transporter [Bacteroidota bacterium]